MSLMKLYKESIKMAEFYPSPIICSELGKTLEIKFNSLWRGQKIRIDDDFITDKKIAKCDYAVLLSDKQPKHTLLYIELKGSNLGRAIEQLESTIKILRVHPDFCGYKEKQAHAVCSKIRIPKTDTSVQKAKDRFLHSYQFILKCHSQKGIVSLP